MQFQPLPKKIRYLTCLHSLQLYICSEEILKPTEELSPINMLSNLFSNTTFYTIQITHALHHAQRCTPTQPSLTYIKAKLTASETYVTYTTFSTLHMQTLTNETQSHAFHRKLLPPARHPYTLNTFVGCRHRSSNQHQCIIVRQQCGCQKLFLLALAVCKLSVRKTHVLCDLESACVSFT